MFPKSPNASDIDSEATVPTRRMLLEILATAFLLLPLLLFPLTRDQGIFAYAGQIILDGGLPYQDFFEIKGPAIHYAYALALMLFGQTMLGVRIFFFIVSLAGAALSAKIAGVMAGRGARLPAALMYGLFSVMGAQGPQWMAWMSSQAEDLMAVLILGAVVMLGSRESLCRPRRLLGAGVLFGIVCSIKPTGLLTVMIVAVVVIWELRETGIRTVSKSVGIAALGVISVGLFVIVFFLAQGAFDDLYATLVTNNASRARVTRFPFLGPGLVQILIYRSMLINLALFGLFAVLLRRTSHPIWRLLWACIFAGLCSVILQGKYHEYHWTPVLACMVPAAAVGLVRLSVILTRPFRKWTAWATVLSVMVVAGGVILAGPARPKSYLATFRDSVQVMTGRMPVQAYQGRFPMGSASPEATFAISEFLGQNTRSGDRVLIWGHETLVHFLSGRRGISRFTIDGPLWVESPMRDRHREEFLNDFDRSPPGYVVIVSADLTPLENLTSAESALRFGPFWARVTQSYAIEAEIGQFQIWRRIH